MNDGTWVSISTPYLRRRGSGQGDPWAEEAAQHGHVGTSRLLGVEEVEAPPEIAAALGVVGGVPVVVRRRLVLADDHPVELADSYYPASIARGTALAQPGKIRGGAVALLAELGHAPHRADEDVEARLASADERELLRLGEPAPLLVLTRRTVDAGGNPVEVSVMRMSAGVRRLRYAIDL